VLSQSLLKFRGRFQLWLLRWLTASRATSRRIAGHGLALNFFLMELACDTLVVGLEYLGRNTFHSKDLNIETHPVRQRIVNLSKLFLVNLAQVHGETFWRN
jgi:hypothetical protein